MQYPLENFWYPKPRPKTITNVKIQIYSWKRIDSFLKILFAEMREISWIEIDIVSPNFVVENFINWEHFEVDYKILTME